MHAYVKTWIRRDGDAILTKEEFVFYVFGYEHPRNHVLSFLKYIPLQLKTSFPIRYLERRWKLGNTELARPEKLYTAWNYQKILEALRKTFPQFIHSCPYRGKEVLAVPFESIERVYAPQKCLQRLFEKKRRDRIQKLALELISFLSTESKVPLENFGIHGSIALDMHTSKSDIDIVVYGSENFRTIEKTVNKLAEENLLEYVFTKSLDRKRKHRGRYKKRAFVYNAVRKINEINVHHGNQKYFPIGNVTFTCEVAGDNETMFRPAIYHIKNYQPLDSISRISKNELPTMVVSMIGYYRNVARRGETLRVSGTLERVVNTEKDEVCHQVVVGTGMRENEYLRPL